MRRRLYFLFPSREMTQDFVNCLLLKHVTIKQIHVMAKETSLLKNLPEASILQKTDIRHSLFVGCGIGALIGLGGGLIAHHVLEMPLGAPILAMILVFGFLGGWAATMIGMSTPSIYLRPFLPELNEGQILVMVDIAKEQVQELNQLVIEQYPSAHPKGVEPTIPSFP